MPGSLRDSLRREAQYVRASMLLAFAPQRNDALGSPPWAPEGNIQAIRLASAFA